MAECSGKTYDGWHYHSCRRKATAERDGKWYCPSHDPINIEKREDAKESKRKSKQCTECGWRNLENYWDYCPHCGSKIKRSK